MTIKNADLPAMPIPLEDGSVFNYHGPTDGLTKREYLAALAMQGLLSGGYCIDDARNRLIDVPSEAVNLADVLLAELEKSNDN